MIISGSLGREALLKSPKRSNQLAAALLTHDRATLGIRTDDKHAGTVLTQDGQTGNVVPVVPRATTNLDHGHTRAEPLGGHHDAASVGVLVGTFLLVLITKNRNREEMMFSL